MTNAMRTSPPRDPNDLMAEAKQAGHRGEQILAFDIAQKGLEHHPGHTGLQRQAIYALILSGATQEANRRFIEYGLASQRIHPDIAALEARLLKESAFTEDRVTNTKKLKQAALAYQRLFEQTQESYYGINAASLFCILGETDLAQELAQATLRLTQRPQAQGTDAHVQQLIIRAEAALLLTDETSTDRITTSGLDSPISALLSEWQNRTIPDLSTLTTLRKQWHRLRHVLGPRCDEVLNKLQPPTVLYYCGRTFTDAQQIPSAEELQAYLNHHKIGTAFGALSCGADILCAEAIINAGHPLHLILPFNGDIHRQMLPEPHTNQWRTRFDQCLNAARSITIINDTGELIDEPALDYAREQAMGRALLHAHLLDAQVRLLCLNDKQDANRETDTAPTSRENNTTHRLIKRWQALGLPCDELTLKNIKRDTQTHLPTTAPQPSERFSAAIIFGDIKGFSQIPESQLPAVLDEVLPRMAAVLERHSEHCRYRNTWGDGLFVVMNSANSAAQLCTQLHQTLDRLFNEPNNKDEVSQHPNQPRIALRLGVHFGPMLCRHDPLLGRENIFGNHVSRTARIEPVTPPGQTYVTDAFAARLQLEQESAFTTEYVGAIEAAKGHGSLPMYLLKATSQSDG